MSYVKPRLLSGFILSLGVGVLLSLSQANAQEAAQRTVEQHGDWAALCKATDAKSCYIVQRILLGDNDKPVLELAVGRPANNPTEISTMILTLPLGIRLPEGFGLEIGTTLKRKYPFERCIKSGCQTEIQLDTELVQNLQGQNEGRVVFLDSTKKTIAIPFSLKGFTKAYSKVLGQ
ncbi:invasion associated locus B family protein [Kiloniella laminariae]|uniref:Invasion associated locus B family protein n=1 Tax=Kiloniella laminariae TaxID=454162 RepID=A0ABT4LHA0_9PROT|nr:invasion associated locus B family protein [Kiloniella laminariae]MCZ4280469.1 invasion associated locus B family protein [Kiloniella laminariae]